MAEQVLIWLSRDPPPIPLSLLSEVTGLTVKRQHPWVTICCRPDGSDQLVFGVESIPGIANPAIDHWKRQACDDSVTSLMDYRLPVSIIALDESRQALRLVRDPLGERSLYYVESPNGFWMSNDERTLLGIPDSRYHLNPVSVACMAAGQYPDAGNTLFKEIHEVPPGHRVTLQAQTHPVIERYYQFNHSQPIRKLRFGEAKQQLRTLIDQAIQRRLPSGGTVGLNLSGGMDSTVIAASAAGLIEQHQTKLSTVSYRFIEFPECDETRFSDAVCDSLGLPANHVNCDTELPLAADWYSDIDFRELLIDPYRSCRFALNRTHFEQQSRYLLTGDFGDQLYLGRNYVLRDLFLHGWFSMFFSSLRRIGPFQSWLKNPQLRRLLPLVGWRARRRTPTQEWLTENALSLIPKPSSGHEFLGKLSRVDQVSACINNLTARAAAISASQLADQGLILLTPFRDLDLMEFMLSLPAHYLHRSDIQQSRWITRSAFRGQLPEAVLQRPEKTSLLPLLKHAIFERNRQQVHDLLDDGNAWWRNWIRPDWVKSRLQQKSSDDQSLFILWICICMEIWRSRLPDNVRIDHPV